jgi:hypothetical protein
MHAEGDQLAKGDCARPAKNAGKTAIENAPVWVILMESSEPVRRGGRVAEGGGLLNRFRG